MLPAIVQLLENDTSISPIIFKFRLEQFFFALHFFLTQFLRKPTAYVPVARVNARRNFLVQKLYFF